MGRRRRSISAAELRRRVEARADRRCEYCHAPQAISGYRFHLEHIIPKTADGSDDLPNRALSCATCNLAKGDRMTGVDHATGARVDLFNPRTQAWSEHFAWSDEETLEGLTPEGRATVAALRMNSSLRREARRHWFATGWLP